MRLKILYLVLIISSIACENQKKEEVITDKPWQQIIRESRDKTLTLMMWQGDPLINRFMSDYIVPELKEQYGITLNIVNGQGNTIVSTLMTELEAGVSSSEVDMIWINGETFYQLRQIKALYGPFVERLPNNEYIDLSNPFIAYDFQQPADGYECPWGNVQLALIYNGEQVKNPPQNLIELEKWVREHPGKFTIGNDFTGMTVLKSWLIHLAGGKGALKGDFNEEKYKKYSAELWEYLNRIKPYWWNKGQSFPSSVAQIHQLFANGEVWFTMSNNDSEVDNKIVQGIFPESSRAYVPETGTIQNSHFMGIVNHSSNKEAAMVVCNFLISPAVQWEKMQPAVWGDGTVLSVSALPVEWQQKFQAIPGRKNAPDREFINERAFMEPAPEYMIRLFEDFRKEVIEK
ncbi:ABC transporter substrate-binding protein [Fulvivirga sp. M361]|uniref:ABC transporter substrate-binding protein n=1 Tax=Fulvivirga sp. M361 TaxID=2594266 RepID=UPI001179A5A9|nr:ABC transporter substrate-binding protein [Fulvivirga sp. M361]TRX52204.1 ABC transporter substrate-binding protein [Fulvivirga sp. M361]